MSHKVLILTDHRNHSSENSLYELAVKMLLHPSTQLIDVATRHNPLNHEFFSSIQDSALWATRINEDFSFQVESHPLFQDFREIDLSVYGLIWLRMPPPLSLNFLDYLADRFENQVIINDPYGIYQTGSKAFLTNFQAVCPPIKICSSVEDILEFKSNFPIVLKPFREYGGKGIVRLIGDQAWIGQQQIPLDEFLEEHTNEDISYLGVKYLKNVKEGDKRIIVVNGQVLGASLRLPAKDSWLCNVAMGGSSHAAKVSEEEYAIVDLIDPALSRLGIVMYGVDTLVGDDGKRVLSEINTTSIGGLPQISKINNEPLVEQAIDLIWDYHKAIS